PIPPPRRSGPGAQQVGLPVQVDADGAVRNRRQSFQDPLDDRRAQDGQEWFGQVIRHGSQPLAEAGGGKKDRERPFRHPYELSAEGAAATNLTAQAVETLLGGRVRGQEVGNPAVLGVPLPLVNVDEKPIERPDRQTLRAKERNGELVGLS